MKKQQSKCTFYPALIAAAAVLFTSFMPAMTSPASARGLKNFILRKQAEHGYRKGETILPTSASVAELPASGKQTANGKYTIQIVKSEHKLYIMNGSKAVETFDVSTGSNPAQKGRTGDNSTPEGKFTIMSVQDSTRWLHDFQDGKGVVQGGYGPWYIKLNTRRWYDIAIYGTTDDSQIGGNNTDGCIRLRNEDLNTLHKYAKRGMKVVISH
jgi:lipoprotein-anchoring transpeptidase ErfK/SrfK